jgi:hypothetical protein
MYNKHSNIDFKYSFQNGREEFLWKSKKEFNNKSKRNLEI